MNNTWTTPVPHWEPAVDSVAQTAWLQARGDRVCQWAPVFDEKAPTDCYRVGSEFWLWQDEVGGLRFRAEQPEYFAFPAANADVVAFRRIVTRSWLPAIYPLWGRQVLHAGVVGHRQTGRAIGLVGPTGAGKSTLSYALGQRPDWDVLADDTMAFTGGQTVTLYPLRPDIRLRPRTAEHYGFEGEVLRPTAWPGTDVTLAGLYFLVPHDAPGPTARMTPLPAGERYTRALAQAFALSLDLPGHNQHLMLAYSDLAALPGFELGYWRSFEVLEQVLDVLDRHARTLVG